MLFNSVSVSIHFRNFLLHQHYLIILILKIYEYFSDFVDLVVQQGTISHYTCRRSLIDFKFNYSILPGDISCSTYNAHMVLLADNIFTSWYSPQTGIETLIILIKQDCILTLYIFLSVPVGCIWHWAIWASRRPAWNSPTDSWEHCKKPPGPHKNTHWA